MGDRIEDLVDETVTALAGQDVPGRLLLVHHIAADAHAAHARGDREALTAALRHLRSVALNTAAELDRRADGTTAARAARLRALADTLRHAGEDPAGR